MPRLDWARHPRPSLRFEALESRRPMASLLVTNVLDNGPGSLRQAILDANADSGPSTIGFAIPGPGFHKIVVPGGLPTITSTVDVDARTQPGYAGSPLVAIDGADSTAGPSDVGLDFREGSTGSSVEGLAIARFYGYGIEVFDQGGITLRGNDIGYDPSGTTPMPGNHIGIA